MGMTKPIRVKHRRRKVSTQYAKLPVEKSTLSTTRSAAKEAPLRGTLTRSVIGWHRNNKTNFPQIYGNHTPAPTVVEIRTALNMPF